MLHLLPGRLGVCGMLNSEPLPTLHVCSCNIVPVRCQHDALDVCCEAHTHPSSEYSALNLHLSTLSQLLCLAFSCWGDGVVCLCLVV